MVSGVLEELVYEKDTKSFPISKLVKVLKSWVIIKDELIVSRNYRMPIYRTFQIIEKISYRTSDIEYLDML